MQTRRPELSFRIGVTLPASQAPLSGDTPGSRGHIVAAARRLQLVGCSYGRSSIRAVEGVRRRCSRRRVHGDRDRAAEWSGVPRRCGPII